MSKPRKTALVLIFDGVEEIEALTPVDLLRRADIEVTLASLEDSQTIKGRTDILLTPDTSLSQVDPNTFDLFILPGGPGVLALKKNETVLDLLRNRNAAGQANAAICAAPIVFAAAGLLEYKTATSHISVRNELPAPSNDRIVQDGLITTSQGVGTAIEFSLHLIANLINQEAADNVSASIHFK